MHVIVKSLVLVVVYGDEIRVDFVHEIVAEAEIIHYIYQRFAADFLVEVLEIDDLLRTRVNYRYFEEVLRAFRLKCHKSR